jgi:inosine/xanthosine triphosphate pyrophosphatase family protein
MHDINSWFAVEDFINLMRDKQDKSIYLNHLVVAVKDGNPKLFSQRIRGVFIEEPQGEGSALDRIVILDGADGTIAQNQAKGRPSTDDSLLWKDVAEFFCF